MLVLGRQFCEIIASAPNRRLVASHPVYQYLRRRYGFNLKSVTWESGEETNEVLLSELALLLKEHPSTLMFWENEPHPANVARLHSMGIDSLVFDPCEGRPVAGDVLDVMQQNWGKLKRVVSKLPSVNARSFKVHPVYRELGVKYQIK